MTPIYQIHFAPTKFLERKTTLFFYESGMLINNLLITTDADD